MAAVVDSQAIAAAVLQGIQLATKQAEKPPASQFDQVFASLAANPENDPATLEAFRNLLDAKAADIQTALTSKQQAEMTETLQRARDSQAHSTIRAAIHEFKDKGVIELEEGDEELYANRIIAIFNKEPKYEAQRQKAANGFIDAASLKEIAAAVINKEAEKRGKGTAKTTFTGGARQDVTPAAKGGEGGDLDAQIAGLQGRQRALYNAQLGIAQSASMDRNSKEAKEFALRAALRVK